MNKQLILFNRKLLFMIKHPLLYGNKSSLKITLKEHQNSKLSYVIFEKKRFGGGPTGLYPLERVIRVYSDGTSEMLQTNEFTFQCV